VIRPYRDLPNPKLALLLVWLWAVPALGQGTSATREGRFSFELNSCPTVSAEAVRRILGIEIGDLLVREGETWQAPHDRLTIRCSGPLATIQAVGQSGGPPFERLVSLEDFPGDAAPRALALAGLELLASMNAVVRARIVARQMPSMPSDPSPSPSAPTRQAVPADIRIGASAIWRTFLVDRGANLWGGRIAASRTLGHRWSWAFDAEVAGSRDRVSSLGEVSALLLSSALTFGVHGQSGPLHASIGLGARMGMARLSGRSDDPTMVIGSSVTRPWGGPLVAGVVGARFGRVSLSFCAEFGDTVLSSEGLADGNTALAIQGTWGAIALGLVFHP